MPEDDRAVRAIFRCRFCGAAHAYPNVEEWAKESEFQQLMEGLATACPGNQNDILAPHYEPFDGDGKPIMHYQAFELLDVTVFVGELGENLLHYQPNYKHGDPIIAGMQVNIDSAGLVKSPEDIDASLYKQFASIYVKIDDKIEKCDPELVKVVNEIVIRYARGLSTTCAYLHVEFARKYFLEIFDLGKDTYEEHVINGVSWSWKEIIILMRNASPQLYDLG